MIRNLTGLLLGLCLVGAGCAGGGAGMAGGAPSAERQPPSPDYSVVVGTWEGQAWGEGDTEGTNVTMVLEVSEGALTGHVTVLEQGLDRTPILGAAFQDGILSGYVSMQGMRVDVRLSLDGETLNGSFWAQDMEGVMTLRKRR